MVMVTFYMGHEGCRDCDTNGGLSWYSIPKDEPVQPLKLFPDVDSLTAERAAGFDGLIAELRNVMGTP